MSEAVDEFAIDTAERELVRKKLTRYMKDHRSGAGWLAKRIEAKFPGFTVVLSTLQRFLANCVHTNDPLVAICHRFAESLTFSDPIAKLGERLSIFYGAGEEQDYSGTYVYALDDALGLPDDEIAEKIEVTADAGFFRFTLTKSALRGGNTYDGVLVSSRHGAVVISQDRVLGSARVYLLRLQDGILSGRGMEQAASFFMSDRGKEVDELYFQARRRG